MSASGVSPRLLLGAVAAAAVLASVLIGASILGRAGEAQPSTKPVRAAESYVGVPQRGLVLGRGDAPVTLVEYADLQCPYCALWARDVLPRVVEEYVRTGRVRVVFHGLAFIGPESETALRAVLAAGSQDRLWSFLDGLYHAQGAENGGWVTDDLLSQVAAASGVDRDRLGEDSYSVVVDRQIASAGRAAQQAGVRGTPTFELGRTGKRLELVQDGSFDSLGARIDALLR